MKYLKDFLRVVVFVIVMFLPPFYMISENLVEAVAERRDKNFAYTMLKVKNNIEPLITAGRYTEACVRLAADYDAKSIESYRISTPDIECYQPKSFTVFPPVAANSGPEVFHFEGQDNTFLRFKFEKAEWAYSVLTIKEVTYFGLLKEDEALRKEFYQLMLTAIYIVFTFIFFSVLIAIDSIKTKFRRNGEDPFWVKIFNKTFGLLHLSDIKILRDASRRLIDLKNTLELERDVLQRSLEHTILNEIRMNNQNVPYTFNGTVAKVDINGYSKVVAEGGRQTSYEMATVLENIGCELLQRYGGLFEKTVGDEIVVVFRGDDSHLKAVAFVRDLMQTFSEQAFAMGGEIRKFTLKGSIANSSITFCKRAAGYGFLGDAFTITSRLLEAVTAKDKNVLSVLDVDSAKIKDLVILPQEISNFKFKNMTAVSGYFVSEFISIDDVNHQFHAKYFLSDHHLVQQIRKVSFVEDLAEREQLMNNFSNIEIRMTTEAFANTIIETLRLVVAKPNTKEWNRTLSRLISAAATLIPTLQWKEQYSAELLNIPLNREGRVNAAILQVLMVKDPNKLNLINTESFIIPRDPSHRTRGQILIGLSRHSLNEKLIDQIIKMIHSRNDNESATGIFVGCDVINYHWKEDSAGVTILDNSTDLINLLMKKHNDSSTVLSGRLKTYLTETVNLITQSNEKHEQESVA